MGDAYSNALMKSVNGLDKAASIRTTLFHHGPYKTFPDVEYVTAGWVDQGQQPQAPLDPGHGPGP